MRRRGMLLALTLLLGSVSPAQALEISITDPKPGETVQWRDIVAGRVSPRATVWVVIQPINDGRFWVQPPTSVRSDGRWSVLAYFANSSDFYKGFKFRVRACASPRIPLREGLIFYSWPPCAKWSRVVLVTRG